MIHMRSALASFARPDNHVRTELGMLHSLPSYSHVFKDICLICMTRYLNMANMFIILVPFIDDAILCSWFSSALPPSDLGGTRATMGDSS